ncbi:MAG: hypothetical protein NC094_08935 [Bacteroidales bacterium]|nr:hypothetical protein [Lachnoclostridium sp.]MCM1385128.1 hypothetical protein [Lachnoclostridium sp.]MCM1465530.1 hypothetical protein [Bacteroidales bacterium]
MVTVLAAQAAARKAVEANYFGTLTVTEMKKKRDEETKLTRNVQEVILEGQPCRLSFERLTAAVQSDSAAAVTQVVKLFVSPDVEIKEGSKITITQDGITNDYERSGIPAIYPTHQEIILNPFKNRT